ncbi:NAD(P)-binding protein [Rhizopogon vinicolor AM-OR11-026]|uniref:NAD(P)-binding protein n=1 Tax=Rhizopogon vinicolor AM-OR11-026 TaxID=1314800 RepID=A0A1B7N6F2_9AGAM|nr:NAD(P)-binding protein [Rhizopogon vinicolor AM-OR11-026]
MSTYLSLLGQAFPPKSQFSVDDIPDLTGKVTIVTGGNTGIGKETAKALLVHNAKVYVAARSQEKVEAAIRDLKNSTGKEAIFLKLDLGDLKSVKAAAEEYLSKETKLDILFNNAGVMAPPIDLLTTDGYDLQFGTNVLGHFYFTKLLLPALIATAKSAPDGKARVITTSSSAHVLTSSLNFDTFKDSPARRKLSPFDLYGQSKHGNVVQAFELARRYASEGIVSIPLNPGNIKTDLARHMPSLQRSILNQFLYDVEHGALTQLYAGTVPEAVEFNGKYLVPWARVGPTRKDAEDPKIGEALWNWLEEQVKDI